MLLWPLTREAKVNKGQDRCQIKQLLNRELGCDPQIRNADLSQQQGKTFMQLLSFYEIQSRFQPRLKKVISFICVLIFSTLHIGVVLPFSPWLQALNCRYLKGKISKNWEQGGITYLPWKMRTIQHNTKCCNITFIHIAVLGTAWNLDDLPRAVTSINNTHSFSAVGHLW